MKILELTGLSEPLFLLIVLIVLPLTAIAFLYLNVQQERAIDQASISIEDQVVSDPTPGLRRRT